jgi:membrane protease YdiL (CAAX protease family)
MRKRALLEALAMFGLIMAYIWKLRGVHPAIGIAIPVLMVLSHVVRRESPRALGFQVRNLGGQLYELGLVLILIAVALLGAGMTLGTVRQIGFVDVLLSLAAYLPWGLVQEYALNGYFLNRFDAALSKGAASLLAALLFCAAHAPNPFLMAITLPLGWCATQLYRRTRNLYLLGIVHAIVGLLLFLMVPDSVSRHMRVGPGWIRP